MWKLRNLIDRSRGTRGAVLGVLVAGALAAWWALRIEAPVRGDVVPVAGFDDYAYYHPTLRFAFAELRAGRLPLWNPYQHAGSPFFATGQHGLLYPLSLPYLLLSTPHAERVAALLHLGLGFVGVLLLARTLAIALPGAVVAGVAFVLAPAVADLVVLPNHLYAVVWLPLQLSVAHRLAAQPRRWRWRVLLGLAFALQYLGGYPQFVVMSAYAVGAYVAFRLWPARRRRLGPRHAMAVTASMVAAIVVAASVSAPQLVPSLELAVASVRGNGLSLEAAAINSAQGGAGLLRVLLPMHDVQLGTFTTLLPYVGLPALLLAVLAPIASPRRRGLGFFVAFAAVTWMLGLGTNGPLFALYHALPGGDAFRCPFRFFPLTVLGLAVLAGFGVDALQRGSVGTRRLGWTAGVLLVGALAAITMGRWSDLPVPVWPEKSAGGFTFPALPMGEPLGPAIVALGVQLLGAAAWLVLVGWSGERGRAVLVWTLPLLVYASLFRAVINTTPIPVTHPDLHTMPESAANYLRGVQRLDRTVVLQSRWPMAPAGRYPPARAGILHHLYVVGDRENVYVRRFADYADRLVPDEFRRVQAEVAGHYGLPGGNTLPQGEVLVAPDSKNLRLLDLLGARFLVEGPAPLLRFRPVIGRFRRAFVIEGVSIYENLAALPRAFVVQRIHVEPDTSRALDRLVAADFDPRVTAVVEHDPGLPPPTDGAPPSTARIVEYAAHAVAVEVDGAVPGLLVLTDQAYPGWEAHVDDRAAPIVLTDVLFRGVVVPPGRHRVTFVFVPRSLRWGIAAGGGGVVVLAVAALATRRRRQRRVVATASRSGTARPVAPAA